MVVKIVVNRVLKTTFSFNTRNSTEDELENLCLINLYNVVLFKFELQCLVLEIIKILEKEIKYPIHYSPNPLVTMEYSARVFSFMTHGEIVWITENDMKAIKGHCSIVNANFTFKEGFYFILMENDMSNKKRSRFVAHLPQMIVKLTPLDIEPLCNYILVEDVKLSNSIKWHPKIDTKIDSVILKKGQYIVIGGKKEQIYVSDVKVCHNQLPIDAFHLEAMLRAWFSEEEFVP